MFGVYFGKYLEDVGVLTHEQYMEIVEASRTARVKMGLLAVSEGLMTKEQADEVNQLQAMKDARFGDIAVEKGYLTDEQVGKLLKKQGDSYLLFVQALVERKLLTLEDIQKYLNHYKKSERYTALEIDALKSSDIDKIIQIFLLITRFVLSGLNESIHIQVNTLPASALPAITICLLVSVMLEQSQLQPSLRRKSSK